MTSQTAVPAGDRVPPRLPPGAPDALVSPEPAGYGRHGTAGSVR